jgi:predicted PurR-regulated permease PerM
MEATVAALLLVTASVVLACVVVTYAVNIVQITIDTHNFPEVNKLQDYVNNLLNQTQSTMNDNAIQEPDSSSP